MGLPGGWELLIILVIVLLIFGTKKLKNVGKDLGGAIKGFKDATKAKGESDNDSAKADQGSTVEKGDDKVIEGEVTSKETEKEKEKHKA